MSKPNSTYPSAQDGHQFSRRALMLSRLDFDVRILDAPQVSKRELRSYLELKLSEIYPSRPEEAVFDYKWAGSKRIVLFIGTRAALAECRSASGKARLFLPYCLVKKWVKKRASGKTVCFFWWRDWLEMLLFDDGRLVCSRVLQKQKDWSRDPGRLRGLIPEQHREAARLLFCSREHKPLARALISSAGFIPDEIVCVEDAIHKIRKRSDFLFVQGKPFLSRFKAPIAAALVICALVPVFLQVNQNITRRESLRVRLREQVQKSEQVSRFLDRKLALEEQLAELESRRPRNLYRFFSELADVLGPSIRIQRLTIDERGNFQIDGSGVEPLSLMSELEKKDNFTGIHFPRISREPEDGIEKFTLSGIYNDR